MRRHACFESFTGAEKGIRELLSKKRCSVQMHLHITQKNKGNNYLNAAPHSITRYDSLWPRSLSSRRQQIWDQFAAKTEPIHRSISRKIIEATKRYLDTLIAVHFPLTTEHSVVCSLPCWMCWKGIPCLELGKEQEKRLATKNQWCEHFDGVLN